MASQPAESRMNHPTLGPGVAVYDERGRTKVRLAFEIAMIPLGMLGPVIAQSDIAAGNTLLGIAQAAVGVIVSVYGFRATVMDFQHLANPIRLVIARDGFELFPGHRRTARWEVFPSARPISWDEVESIGDRKFPDSPRVVKLHVKDAAGMADRLALSQLDRLVLRVTRGDVVIGAGLARPIQTVEEMMRLRLAEYRRAGSAGVGVAAPTTPPGRRRAARKRQA